MTDRPRHQLVEELFQAALDLPDDQRLGYVEQNAPDSRTRDEVLGLLRHHEPGQEVFGFPESSEPAHPESIGPFRIQRVLGEGGMGVVYHATQLEPVQREVALKLVRPGLDTREVLDRFERERQTLARLEHPNIARIHEAGVDAEGRPWFAMEYVDGEPIHRYCDRQRLTARERVALLAKVCRGVQAAHQRGVLHRDLKPTNILVTTQDGQPVPKIIDFGVAKATDVPADGVTRHGQLIGTPEYMSPEQAAGEDVDVRTDVYSLGVVLYELLAGVLPLDAEALREAGLADMLRMIREDEPSRPSTRISTLGDAASEAAGLRRANPRTWARSLRGELDWIALRALEKDRERRYASASELADDLRAYLDDEPVRARPSTGWYTARKFARRHRTGVAVAGVALVGLAVFAVAMTLQAGRIARERDRANQKTAVAEQVTDFLVEIFEGADPVVAQGEEPTARELLARGAERIGDVEDPRVRSELASVLAGVYESLGRPADALPLAQDAVAQATLATGPSDPLTLSEQNNLANVLLDLGRVASAESLYTLALEGWQAQGLAEDPRALDPLHNLAVVLTAQGRWEEAEPRLLEVAERRRVQDGEDDPKFFMVQRRLAHLYENLERYEESRTLYEQVLEGRRRVLGEDHPETILTLSNLAGIYAKLDRVDEAKALLQEADERSRRVLGEDHPEFMDVQFRIASLYYGLEDYERVAEVFERLADFELRRNGPEHPRTLVALNNLSAVKGQLKQYAEAAELMRGVVEVRARLLGEDHPFTQQSRFTLAGLSSRLGDTEESIRQFRIAVDHGFAHSIVFHKDADETFGNVLDDPRYQELVETVRARLDDRP